MSWARFEHRTATNRKVLPLSDSAFRLWFNMITWSVGEGTDGLIDASIPLETFTRNRYPSKLVRELLERGLLDDDPDGLLVHDFGDYQPSGVDQKRAREADAKRKRDARRSNQGGR